MIAVTDARTSVSDRDREDDAELVRRLVAGDDVALELAYRKHAARCRAVAMAILEDASLAQDAVQEAFVSLWRHRGGLVVRSAGIAPWLTVVTRNAALAMARAAQRRAAREATVERQDHADSTEDVVSRLERGVEAQRLRRAVMELSPEQRDVISQAYFGRRTLAEIAQRTGTPLGTVKRRAQLALAKLAKALESVS